MTPSLSTVTLTLLCLAALAAQVNPTPDGVIVSQHLTAQSNSRSHCQTMHGTCEFYSNCIEPAFHCGTQGFTISYAKNRCTVIKKLRHSVSRPARNWAHKTETCFHTKLMNLLKRYPDSHPDPQTCLKWERDASTELNSCYNDAELRDAFLQLPDADISKLVSLFRVSEYYSPVMDASLVELVKTRSLTLASEVVRNHTLSMHHRILLCVKGTKYNADGIGTTPSPEDYVQIVSAKLAAEESEYFHYAGPDQLEDMDKVGGLCYDRSSRGIDVNAYMNDYHLVTWFTTNHSHDDIGKIYIKHRVGIKVNGVMFELTTTQDNNLDAQRKITQCGDGIRQVSESCDFANSYPGCTIDCEVRDGSDCTTDKLEPSRCWREVCGDGLRTRGEECDSMGAEGCNDLCRIADTHLCTRVYNATSYCTSIQALSLQPQQAPARLISQEAGSSKVASSVASSEDRPTAILPIILGMVGTTLFSMR